jgi:hypothetical protein
MYARSFYEIIKKSQEDSIQIRRKKIYEKSAKWTSLFLIEEKVKKT